VSGRKYFWGELTVEKRTENDEKAKLLERKHGPY